MIKKNMYLHELKAYRKSTIIWTSSLVAIIIMFMAMFPTFSKDVSVMDKIIGAFPDEIKKALGLSTLDLSTVLGFYGYIFGYILLCGAIQAMNLGVGIISVEVREKTADFLLVKPVTRTEIITSKLLAALTSIAVTNVIYFTASFIMAQAVKQEAYSIKVFFMISLTMLFVQLIFMSIGVFISIIPKKIKSVLPVSLSVVFGFYVINLFGAAVGGEAVRYITPFRYFDLGYIIKNGAYEVSFIILSIVILLVSIIGSYILYSKKDIPSV